MNAIAISYKIYCEAQQKNQFVKFVEFLNLNRYMKHGLKVRDKRTGDVWILAAVSATHYQWINTVNGCMFGEPFGDGKDPLERLLSMDYEGILPEVPIER